MIESNTEQPNPSQEIPIDGSRSKTHNGPDDDNDEPHILEKTENKISEDLKEAMIYYYPSRGHPESVSISFKELACLEPEGYLSSDIMNFYILYLQRQPHLTNRSLSDYLLLTTYFYPLLRRALSSKGKEKERSFKLLRSWWKDVNIFQKAYVVVPIHGDSHWSLIIICIPDKKDTSGLMMLHLDSLSMHPSNSVFENIRSFLIEEKKYLDQECASSVVWIHDNIWKNLSERIEGHVIDVPQQANGYDCGLFVLCYIEHFMKQAPKRMKKTDLHMFSKGWFQHEVASSLRETIKKYLVQKFNQA